ncbi:Bicaudal D-related protein 1, partial [Ophiophagus hannah]
MRCAGKQRKKEITLGSSHRPVGSLLQHLEQEKHELRRRFENKEGEWEGRVSELESDVKQLQDELEKQQVHLREADREKTRAVQELSEQNQRLLDQLSKASEVERKLSTQVHVLQEDFREKRSSTNQHIVRLESLQAEIKMLRDRKQDLERRLSTMMEENNLLQGTVEELQDRVLILERQSHEKDMQVGMEAKDPEMQQKEEAKKVKMEELNEERSLQAFNSSRMSLLSEIEQSMEAEELEQEREQLRLQLWEAYCQVRYLCTHLRGNDSADSAVSTDSSMDESSETSSAKDVPAGSLRAALSELKRLIQSVIDGTDSPVTLLSVEMTSLKEERDRLRGSAEDKEMSEQLLKAIRDRDEAISKKNAVEMELAKCRMDMMSLNSQLLDAIQQKLNLSQQLEAWQDDMQRLIDQQLMDRHPKEWSQTMMYTTSSHGAKRRARPSPLLKLQQQSSEPREKDPTASRINLQKTPGFLPQSCLSCFLHHEPSDYLSSTSSEKTQKKIRKGIFGGGGLSKVLLPLNSEDDDFHHPPANMGWLRLAWI